MSKQVKNPTRLQSILAVSAFVIGTVIGCVSLFVVPPPDVISNSAMALTSEFLLISSAMLGVNIAFDTKLQKFKAEIEKEAFKNEKSLNEELPDEI